MRLLSPALLFAACALVPLVMTSNYQMGVANLALISLMAVLGLNFVSGLTGQISFAQAAFSGIGAYLTTFMLKFGVPFVISVPIAALATGSFSLILGMPSLRLRSYYLAMATIGFGEIVRLVMINWNDVTGGTSGIRNVPPISFGGVALQGNVQHFYFFLAVITVAIVVASRIGKSGFGRAMVATRDSEIAAQILGINTVRTKLLAFFLSAVYAAIGGGLYASYVGYISPEQYSNQASLLYFTMLVVGGSGSIAGVVLGTMLLSFLPETLRFLGQWYLIVYGVAVIIFIIVMPAGLIGLFRLVWNSLGNSRLLRRQPA
jgi:branched-chain amino acid transport system permease protein